MSTPEETKIIDEFIRDTFSLFQDKAVIDKCDGEVYFETDTASKFVHLVIMFIRNLTKNDKFILS